MKGKGTPLLDEQRDGTTTDDQLVVEHLIRHLPRDGRRGSAAGQGVQVRSYGVMGVLVQDDQGGLCIKVF